MQAGQIALSRALYGKPINWIFGVSKKKIGSLVFNRRFTPATAASVSIISCEQNTLGFSNVSATCFYPVHNLFDQDEYYSFTPRYIFERKGQAGSTTITSTAHCFDCILSR